MNGRLLPLGWWHFLRRGRIMDRVRVGFLGVKPEFQHTGIAAAMYVEHFDMAVETPQKWGEMGWILETNRNMNRAMEAMGGRDRAPLPGLRADLLPIRRRLTGTVCRMQRSDSQGLPTDVPVAVPGPLHPRAPRRARPDLRPRRVLLLVLAVGSDGWWDTAGLVLIGYCVWTLFEYWLHRLVFHFEPEHGIGAKLHWMIHGVHHDHPNDPLRLVMPPAASIPLAIIVVGTIFLVAGSLHGPAVAAGFLAGYLIYDEIHYALHHHVPKSRLGKRLRELHMRHHFQDDEKGFGISAPYWDVVFRTYAERR